MTENKTTSKSFELPEKVRLSSEADRISRPIEPITLDDILAEVRRRTELTDWGDPGFLKVLEAQIRSFNQDADPSPFSHRGYKRNCAYKIVQRMQIVDLWKRHPEILQQPLVRPIFVVGMPRTGTTLLHRLLSQDPKNRPLLHWEQQTPAPPPEPESYTTDERIGWAKRALDNLLKIAPQLGTIHPMEATQPEECNGLFESTFTNMAIVGLHRMPSFVDWLMTWDMTETYTFYKGELQMLNWKMPPSRWCLKCPSHLYFLDALLNVFPDASILWNHRNPQKTLASASSLVSIFRKMTTGKDAQSIGKEVADGLERSVMRAMEVRQTADPKRFFDVSFKRLVTEPIALVRDIYDYFGYEWSSEVENAMNDWLAENKRHKHGVHQYALEDFGLDAQWLDRKFAPYLKMYRNWL